MKRCLSSSAHVHMPSSTTASILSAVALSRPSSQCRASGRRYLATPGLTCQSLASSKTVSSTTMLCVTRLYRGTWGSLAEDTGYTEDDLRTFFEPQHKELQNKVAYLKSSLVRLQLNTTEVRSAGWRNIAFTTFLNVLRFKDSRRSDLTRANERTGFLARAIHGQWLAQQMYDRVVYEDKHRTLRSTDRPRYGLSYRAV